MQENSFVIYTDGSCDNLRYPNYGGWGYVRNKKNAELITEIIEDKCVKNEKYIMDKVRDINTLFKITNL